MSYDTTNVKNVVKFCVPTWSIFAGLVTYSRCRLKPDNTIIRMEEHARAYKINRIRKKALIQIFRNTGLKY